MKCRGFSIVELIIIITVMGILLVLGVVNLSGGEANSRDSERKIDIESIANHLESYYILGLNGGTTSGEYPSVEATVGLIGNEVDFLENIDDDSIKAPGLSTSSLFAATNNTQTTSGVTPQPTVNQYIYQPIASDGSLCDNAAKECRKFNLYFRTEVDGIINMQTSKKQ